MFRTIFFFPALAMLALACSSSTTPSATGDSGTPAADAATGATTDAGKDAGPTGEMDSGAEDATATTPGSIVVNVTYTGTKTGELILVALKKFPPTTPPNGIGRVANPVFPQSVTIKDLDPASYTVVAVIDAPPASPTMPGPEDSSSAPKMAVEVKAGQATMIEMTIP
jgi:hypothetical protein